MTGPLFFNPRTPCGVRPSNCGRTRPAGDFNPRTPCGVRPAIPTTLSCRRTFQSTHPLRGATTLIVSPHILPEFQSTHPLRGATLRQLRFLPRVPISIHAPLAGCDRPQLDDSDDQNDFNPRTHCGVRLMKMMPSAGIIANFNPRTHCGVRLPDRSFLRILSYFNPRTHCGVRLPRSARAGGLRYFNPRTHCGVRPRTSTRSTKTNLFQSTHPLRGATVHRNHLILV